MCWKFTLSSQKLLTSILIKLLDVIHLPLSPVNSATCLVMNIFMSTLEKMHCANMLYNT